MENVLFYGCYDFNDEWLMIEMLLDCTCDDIDWGKFVVPQEELKPDLWQCAYLEQYLNEEGTERICDLYDEPEEAVSPCRAAFFIYKLGMPKLRTPYGEFDLTNPQDVPERLVGVVEMESDEEEE